MRLQSFSGSLFPNRDTLCKDASMKCGRACLQRELASFGLGDRDSGLHALGNHFPFLLRERGVYVQSEVVAVTAQRCNDKMHLVFHEAGYEVHVPRQAV
jgi:hypothetical protein